MRTLLLLLLMGTSLFGTYYNMLQLNAESMIFPKLLLLKKDPSTLLHGGSIRFYIVYEPEDGEIAEHIKSRMQHLYADAIEGYPFDVHMVQYSRLGDAAAPSAMLLLRSSAHLAEAAAYAKARRIVTFAYDVCYLEKGFLFSLGIERTTLIYLNRRALSEYGIEFSDVLYQIVRFVDEDTQSGLTVE